MKEKYESLSLATLKDLAKARGLKGISTMRKPELIERMLEEDRKEQTADFRNSRREYHTCKTRACGSRKNRKFGKCFCTGEKRGTNQIPYHYTAQS